jgi:hypothetical protein
MSEERKLRLPWIVAVLIGLPVLYVTSFGPVCWMAKHEMISMRNVCQLYRPLVIIDLNFRHSWIRRSLEGYEELWSGSSTVLFSMEFIEERKRIGAFP